MIRNETYSTRYLSDMIERLNLYPELRKRTTFETVVNRVQRDISINQTSAATGNGGPSTLTFTLSYIGDDPQKVREVADALAAFYIQQNDDMRSKTASQIVSDAETTMKEQKRQYDEASSKYSSYLATHAGKLPEQIQMKAADLATTRLELGTKTNRVATLKGQVQSYELAILQAQSAPAPTTAPAIGQTIEQQIAALQAREQTLLDQKAGPENVQLLSVRQKIRALQALPPEPSSGGSRTAGATTQVDVYRKGIADANEEMATLNKEIAKLEERQRSLAAEIASIPSRSPELTELDRNVTLTREQYEAALRAYNQAFSAMQIERTQENEEFRILEPASVPAEPAGPNRITLIVGGIVGALALGLGIAFVRDQFDTSFHTIDDLRGFTQVPILASIPHIVTNAQKARRAAILMAGACALLVTLAFVSYGAYEFATRHAGLTRLVTK